MPTTYTPSLTLSLLGTGEDSGNWGSLTNTNLSLIEQAIAGGSGERRAIPAPLVRNGRGTGRGHGHARLLAFKHGHALRRRGD